MWAIWLANGTHRRAIWSLENCHCIFYHTQTAGKLYTNITQRIMNISEFWLYLRDPHILKRGSISLLDRCGRSCSLYSLGHLYLPFFWNYWARANGLVIYLYFWLTALVPSFPWCPISSTSNWWQSSLAPLWHFRLTTLLIDLAHLWHFQLIALIPCCSPLALPIDGTSADSNQWHFAVMAGHLYLASLWHFWSNALCLTALVSNSPLAFPI